MQLDLTIHVHVESRKVCDVVMLAENIRRGVETAVTSETPAPATFRVVVTEVSAQRGSPEVSP